MILPCLHLKSGGEILKKLIVPARDEELDKVQDFIKAELDANNCSVRTQIQLQIAVEEIFVNIAHYAYESEDGVVEVRLDIGKKARAIEITFIDSGKPYNPLKKPDPDITLSADNRSIGGLGIYMVKRIMDGITYKYKDNRNILTIIKHMA